MKTKKTVKKTTKKKSLKAQTKQMKAKLEVMKLKAATLARQNEIKAREGLHKLFNGGLLLIGKGFMNARKANEAFVAETHRKAKQYIQEAQAASEPVKNPIHQELKENTKFDRAAIANVPNKNLKHRTKVPGRTRAQPMPTARSH